MKKIPVLASALCFALLSFEQAYAGGPSDYVDRLSRAIRNNDFDTVYKHDYWSQRDISEIKQKEPTFLWGQKLSEHYRQAKVNFPEAHFGYPDFAQLIVYDPKVEVIEVKNSSGSSYAIPPLSIDVYTRLKFESVEKSPLWKNRFTYAFNGGILREAIFKLTFTRAGEFLVSDRLHDQDVPWQNLQKQILQVHIWGLPPDRGCPGRC